MDVKRVIKSCRACYSTKLTFVMSLGGIYVSDFVSDGPEHGKIPLDLLLCNKCSLLQLRHTTNPELLYREYWYRSGINEAIISDLKDIVDKAQRIVPLEKGDIVVDIGCNDGTLLRLLPKNTIRIGFEPAKNLVELAQEGGNNIINNFFGLGRLINKFLDIGHLIVSPGVLQGVKLIFSIAMFYDLDHPNSFVRDVKKCLHPDGLWIIEMRYLPLMLGQTDIGNICHEHLEYYSLRSLSNLLWRHGLQVFDVEINDVNGGSFRVYVRHAGVDSASRGGSKWPAPLVDGRVEQLQVHEYNMQLHTFIPYALFAERVKNIGNQLQKFVKKERRKGKVIHVYGASTKGNTMLQLFKLNRKLIEAAADRDPRKIGKMTVGTYIPIITEEESRKRADYFLILPWHFLQGAIKRETEFLKRGGKFIVPLPDFKVIGWEDLNANR